MNSINIIGRIGKEIELRYLPSGKPVANFSIAVDQGYKDKNGQKVDKTSWFDIVAFNGAEAINQYFHSGSKIGITGELEQQTWKTQDGSNRSKVVIKLQSFSFIDSKSDKPSSNYSEKPNSSPEVEVMPKNANGAMPEVDVDIDEIPFN